MPVKGKAGKVALKRVAAADAPGRCLAAAERVNGAAFSVAATAQGVPKYCFVYASRPAELCAPGDKKQACRYKSLGSYLLGP
jgi:hypothetical protein